MQQGPSKTIRSEFAGALKDTLHDAYPQVNIDDLQLESTISTSKQETGGLASSVAFKLAKMARRSPGEIAESLASQMDATRHIRRYESTNGYINAFVDEKVYSSTVVSAVSNDKDSYGKSDMGKSSKVIVEFPSVNPAHPWHVGHLRNAVLGDTVANLMVSCSYSVEREDYIDDLGLQAAQALWGWLHISDKPDKKFDQFLGELYVAANKDSEKKETKDAIDELLKKLEDSATDEARIGREISERCVLAQQETAFAYGIYHDVMVCESDIVRAKLLDKMMKIADEHGVLDRPTEGKYAGATVVKLENITKYAKELEGSREDAKVIIRSNGIATYIAKDFAFHAWKFGLIEDRFLYKKLIEMQPNGRPLLMTAPAGSEANFGGVRKAINVIDVRQTYEQLIMRIMFTLLGNEEISGNLIHLSYGPVNLEDAKLSGRKGNWISYTADDILRETKEKVKAIVSENLRKVKLSEVEAEEATSKVALSAIKFEFLKISPEKEIIFTWESALNLEGNSGPYCLYTYARCSRILEKAGASTRPADFLHISRGYDFALIKHIGMFQETVEKACNECRPNVITDYLLGLASLFSKFYEAMPVLKGGDAMQDRLALVSATRQVMKNALSLLGIGVVEKM